jgi:hypothetical protein
MFSFKIRSIPPDPSTLSLPEPPSPMPDQVRSMEQAMTEATISNERLPAGTQTRSRGTSTSSGQSGGGKAEEYRKWDERGREWLYGYVWFEQRKDGGITRGYMQVSFNYGRSLIGQKSLVILTHLPLPALFMAVLETIAPIFFEHGYSALEAACHSVAAW